MHLPETEIRNSRGCQGKKVRKTLECMNSWSLEESVGQFKLGELLYVGSFCVLLFKWWKHLVNPKGTGLSERGGITRVGGWAGGNVKVRTQSFQETWVHSYLWQIDEPTDAEKFVISVIKRWDLRPTALEHSWNTRSDQLLVGRPGSTKKRIKPGQLGVKKHAEEFFGLLGVPLYCYDERNTRQPSWAICSTKSSATHGKLWRR